MDNSKNAQLEPGVRFYYSLPDWAREQNDEIFATLATILSKLTMNPESPVNEVVSDTLKSLKETDTVRRAVVELILEHPDDYGKITWVKEEK